MYIVFSYYYVFHVKEHHNRLIYLVNVCCSDCHLLPTSGPAPNVGKQDVAKYFWYNIYSLIIYSSSTVTIHMLLQLAADKLNMTNGDFVSTTIKLTG